LSRSFKFLCRTTSNIHIWRPIERIRIGTQVWPILDKLWGLPPGSPVGFFFFGGGGWGLGGSFRVQLSRLGSQMKAGTSESGIQSKKFITPNFQGPWSSNIGPWGFTGSDRPDLTPPYSFWTHKASLIQLFFSWNMLSSIKSWNVAQKRGPPILIWGHTYIQMWAYFSPMILKAHPRKCFIWSHFTYHKFSKVGYIWGTLGGKDPIIRLYNGLRVQSADLFSRRLRLSKKKIWKKFRFFFFFF
jgi:hypothetical protein